MRKAVICLVFALLVVSSLACESTGSSVGGHHRCSYFNGSGSCEGGWKKISGTTSHEIENEDIDAFDAVRIQLTAAVEGGTLRVSCEDPSGEPLSAQASPGSPASLSGECDGSFGDFDIVFEALDGEATGVSYSLQYEVPY